LLPVLKRYIIVTWLLLRRGTRFAKILPGPACAATAASAAYKLKILNGDFQLAAFRTILGLPTIESQAPFDKQRISLLTVLVDNLGSPAEHRAVHETRLVSFGTILAFPLAIYGQPKVSYSRLVRRI
jgi:hypothetical protein